MESTAQHQANETITVTDAQGTGKVEYYDFAKSAGTGGTVSGTADGTYLKGTTVTATATANSLLKLNTPLALLSAVWRVPLSIKPIFRSVSVQILFDAVPLR